MTLRKALLLAAVLAVQFVVFEAGMRLYGGSEASPVFQSLFMRDERIGHRLRPGADIRFATSEYATDIRVNTAGVRDDEVGRKAPNERRIVVLGDSLVLSVQVSLADTFCKRLEAKLNASDPSCRYRVINAGVQGYGPVEEWLFYSHVVAALEPDLVIVGVFVANDAIEAFDSAGRLDRTENRDIGDLHEDATRWVRRVVRQSMVLQTVRLRMDAVRAHLRTRPVPQRALGTYLEEAPTEVDRGLDVTRHCLTLIADKAQAQGARVALMLLPARFQLDDTDFGHLQETVALSGGTMKRDLATERFARALAPLGLPTLDLLPIMRQQPDPATLFFRENVHLTPRGHEVVASAMAAFLERASLRTQGIATPRRQANDLASPAARTASGATLAHR